MELFQCRRYSLIGTPKDNSAVQGWWGQCSKNQQRRHQLCWIRVKTIRSFGSERNDDLMCGAAKDQLDNWWESMKNTTFLDSCLLGGKLLNILKMCYMDQTWISRCLYALYFPRQKSKLVTLNIFWFIMHFATGWVIMSS